MRDPLLTELEKMLPAIGLRAARFRPGLPPPQQLVEAEDIATSARVLFAIAPGPLVAASMLLPAPPVPLEDLASIAGEMNARFPRARIQVRKGPADQMFASFESAHALNPDAPVLHAKAIRRMVDDLLFAARATALMEPVAMNTDGLLQTYSGTDADKHAQVRTILGANAANEIRELTALGGPVLIVDEDDLPTMLLAVRDDTLVVHVRQQTDLEFAALAELAAAVHQEISFGRVLLGGATHGVVVFEYTHRLPENVEEFDVLHAIGGAGALAACFSSHLE